MTSSINEEIIIFRKMIQRDIAELITSGFQSQFGESTVKKILKRSILEKILKITKIVPNDTWFVAVHAQENRVIGTLQLVKHNKQFYSIKFVFTDPTNRKKGVATKLIKYACSQAKTKGAKKVYLNVELRDNFIVKFYEKLGFRKILNSSMVWAQGELSRLNLEKKSQLITINRKSEQKRKMLYNIYKSCIGSKWIDFFELKKNNIINGFAQDYRHFYKKFVFTNESKNYLCLVFKLPFSHNTSVEVYCSMDSDVPMMLKTIFQELRDNGINYSKITLVNINDGENLQLLEKNEFYPYQSSIMGKSL